MGKRLAVLLGMILLLVSGCGADAVRSPGITVSRTVPASVSGLPKGLPALQAIDFAGKRFGWITGVAPHLGGVLLRTTDGGQTWVPIRTPGFHILQMDFRDSRLGWALAQARCGSAGCRWEEILSSRDGGRTWTVQWQGPVPKDRALGDMPACVQVAFPSRLQGYVLDGASLLITANGGKRWLPVTFPVRNFTPLRMSVVGPSAGWVAGQRCASPGNLGTCSPLVLATQNGGATWTVQFTPSGPFLAGTASVSFVNAEDGWFSFRNGAMMENVLYRTQNGGRSWTLQQQALAPGRVNAGPLDFVSPTVGWLPVSSGAGPFPGGIQITRNGGRSWAEVGSGRGWSIHAVFLLSSSDGWAIGRSLFSMTQYFLLHTVNGGRTWQQVAPAPVPTGGVSFVNTEDGYGVGIVADPGVVLRTIDGGRRWAIVGSLPYQLVSVTFVNRKDGWVVATVPPPRSGPQWLYRTQNGGVSWNLVASTTSLDGAEEFPSSRPTLRFFNPAQGMFQVAGWPHADIRVSNNGGGTWTKGVRLPVPIGAEARFSFVNPSSGWAAVTGLEGVQLSRTTNGGRTWSLVDKLPMTYTMEALWFRSMLDGWMLIQDAFPIPTGNERSILHTTNGGRSWVAYRLPGGFPQQINGFSFLNRQDGWLLTDRGLLRTVNGGKTWTWGG